MINKIPSTYFVWNDIKSNIYGYLEKTPFPELSLNDFDIQYVPNRSTPIITSKHTRSKITISVNLQRVPRDKYSSLYSWLNGNNEMGRLVICDDLTKYYKAICTSVKPTHVSYNYSTVAITFDCYPYRYAIDDTAILITSQSTIDVQGGYYAEPIIKIHGSGNGTVTVNGKNVSVYVDDYLTLDSERLLAYKDNVVCLNQMVGSFPALQVGSNTISFDGGITSLEIFKNERWL